MKFFLFLLHFVQDPSSGIEVHRIEADPSRLHPELVDEVDDEEERNSDVGANEDLGVPRIVEEDVVRVEEDDEDQEDETNEGGVRLHGGLVGERVAVDTLTLESKVES